MKLNFLKGIFKKDEKEVSNVSNISSVGKNDSTNYGIQKYTVRGDKALKLENYQEALIHYNKAIEYSPSNEKVIYKKAFVKLCLKDYDGVIEDCNSVIELDPNHSNAYSIRGSAKYEITFLNLINKRKQISDIMERIKSQHNIEDIRNEYSDALNDFNKAIELNPNDAITLRERAILKKEIKDFNGALADFDKAVKSDMTMKERIIMDLQALKIDWEYELDYIKTLKKE